MFYDVAVVAFLVAYNQNKQLIGDNGLLPLRNHMAMLDKRLVLLVALRALF